MTFEDYQRLTKQRRNIADALAMPGAADIEFEPPLAIIEVSELRKCTRHDGRDAQRRRFKPTGVSLFHPWEARS
jgi:hypothetical protein